MSENGRRVGVSFPEGTIGRSMFEDMWIRHEGMPDLAELVDAAENAPAETKARGDWDDHLWNAEELRKRRSVRQLTARQKQLIQLGEAVVSIVTMAKAVDAEADIELIAPDVVDDEVDRIDAPDREAAASWGLIMEALERRTMEAVPGLRDALKHVGPRSFMSCLTVTGHLRPPPWAEQDAQTRSRWYGYCRDRAGFDFYFRLRIACGLDDAKTQPWTVLSQNKPLQDDFARHAAEAVAAGFGSQRDAIDPAGWFIFADTFADRFDDVTLAALVGPNDPWVFANAIAGDMLALGDPHAASARQYASYVLALTADRARRRAAQAAEKEFNEKRASGVMGDDESDVEALMDETGRMVADVGAIFEVVPPVDYLTGRPQRLAQSKRVEVDVSSMSTPRLDEGLPAWRATDDDDVPPEFLITEEAVEIVRECLTEANAAAEPETNGFHSDPSNKWIETFAASFRRRFSKDDPALRAAGLSEVTKQMLFVGPPRGRLYEHLYWHMREEFEAAGAPRERWAPSQRALPPHIGGPPADNFLDDPIDERAVPSEEDLFEAECLDARRTASIVFEDNPDGKRVIEVQLRAAASIANASKAEGEVWATLFLKAADAIIPTGILRNARVAFGGDWWDATLAEAGVPRMLAATAWDAFDR